MTTAVQLRRGTTAETATFTGLEGETTVDTTKDTLVVHNGSSAGGVPIAREDLTNVSPTNLPSITGSATASDDTFLIFDQSALELKKITRAELNNAIEQDPLSNVQIVSGTINGTTIGGTTAAAGSFTTLTSNSTTTLNGTTVPASKTLVTTVDTQALTNKTINLTSNTLVATSAQLRTAVTDETGTGSLVFNTSPTLVTPALGTPASGVVTNLTGTASININGTVGATTASTGAFTTLAASGAVTLDGGTANGVPFLNASKVLTTGSALTFDGSRLTVKGGNAGQFVLDNANEQYVQALFQRNTTANTGADLLLDGSGNTFNFRNLAANMPFVWHLSASPGSPTEQMRLTSTGLGIGTSSPNGRLQVTGGTTNASNLATSYSAAAFTLVPKSTSGFSLAFGSGPSDFPYIQMSAAGTVASDMSLQPFGGNVGIGTSSPTARLSVSGVTPSLTSGNGQLSVFSTNSLAANVGGKISLGGVSGQGGVFDPYGFVAIAGLKENATASNFAGYFTVSTANSGGSVLERMRIDSAGNVGIGTSSPGQLMTISGSSNPAFQTNNTAGPSANFYAASSTAVIGTGSNHPFEFHTNNAERMRIDSSGNLLVGKTTTAGTTQGGYISPAGQYVVAQPTATGAVFFQNTSGGATVGAITINASTTTYATSSDYRLKENIAPMTGALAKVAALKPVTYTWKSTGEADEGFIAHELAEVCPSAVSGKKDAVETYTDEDGVEQTRIKPQGIDTSFLVATLTAAIQELKAINDAQAQTIESLKARLDAANI